MCTSQIALDKMKIISKFKTFNCKQMYKKGTSSTQMHIHDYASEQNSRFNCPIIVVHVFVLCVHTIHSNSEIQLETLHSIFTYYTFT